jgi:hypothetical protein
MKELFDYLLTGPLHVIFMTLVLFLILPALMLSRLFKTNPPTVFGKKGEMLNIWPSIGISVGFYLFAYYLIMLFR